MYLRYLLISNIKSRKWLEGQNQKLSIYINAMYYKHIQFHCKLFLFFRHIVSGLFLCKSHTSFSFLWLRTAFIRFHFSISLFFVSAWEFILFICCCCCCCCVLALQLYAKAFDFEIFFFLLSLATFIFITNCRHLLIHTFRHV